MEFSGYFPIWNQLAPEHQEILSRAAVLHTAKKGTIIHNGSIECTGLILVKSGQLRAYSLSDEGREITLYRLFDRDMCMLSATCMMNSLQIEIIFQAEKDTTLWIIPPDVYKKLMLQSGPIAIYTSELMGTRFTEVMWLVEQIMWKSLDKRVASFLLEEINIEGSNQLRITHETIANHLGTHREVITRMLRHFQSEGMVSLTRGGVEITDEDKLLALAEQ
ncbi:MAG: Crp/Fnr family transcriptional regulator [Clostridia bacterium]|nr:Crp/Fnr family transcriptional regulator [Clostridia bacterium]